MRTALAVAALCTFVSVDSAAADDSGFVTTKTGSLFYESAGEGPAVILLHDGILDREAWDEQFASFAKQFRVVRYDRPGYGRSPAATGSFSNLDDLESLYTTLGIEKAGVVGCSLGGRFAIDFTIAHPERVTALVLVGAVVDGLPASDYNRDRGGHLKFQIPDADYWSTQDPYFVAPENKAARKRVKAILDANPQNLTAAMQPGAGLPEHALGRLGEIKVPTLIIVGDADIADVLANSGAIQAGIAGSRRVVVRGSGHLVHMERPEEFDQLVMRFLTKPPLPLPMPHP